jgi:hypothetical protein
MQVVKGHPCDAERGRGAMKGWKGMPCRLQRCHTGRGCHAGMA